VPSPPSRAWNGTGFGIVFDPAVGRRQKRHVLLRVPRRSDERQLPERDRHDEIDHQTTGVVVDSWHDYSKKIIYVDQSSNGGTTSDLAPAWPLTGVVKR
jgi:hypothetical protein